MPGAIPSIAREQQLIRMLMTYLSTGIIFMLLPGTFLGVWNLFEISSAHSSTSISPAWIQAHGHAQLFGWIGSFILGLGFYSIPNIRRLSAWSFWEGWLSWALWTLGVGLRWFTDVYLIQWTILLPLSAILELLAVALFIFRSIQGHRSADPERKKGLEPWAVLVVGGSIGLLIAMLLNTFESLSIAGTGSSPAFPSDFQNKFLTLSIWGFAVPIAWGFTARWMPAFLGLKPVRQKILLTVVLADAAGILASFVIGLQYASIVFLATACSAVYALRLFESPDKPAKIQDVHASFPVFIRVAYGWMITAALLLVWSAFEPNSDGIGGAGRHAITVGFLVTMVFSVAPRVLPAFLGRSKLFSPTLMFLALIVINAGCLIRVASEIIAYQHYASWAWFFLPLSATLELIGVVLFAINMTATFRQPPLLSSARCDRQISLKADAC